MSLLLECVSPLIVNKILRYPVVPSPSVNSNSISWVFSFSSKARLRSALKLITKQIQIKICTVDMFSQFLWWHDFQIFRFMNLNQFQFQSDMYKSLSGNQQLLRSRAYIFLLQYQIYLSERIRCRYCLNVSVSLLLECVSIAWMCVKNWAQVSQTNINTGCVSQYRTIPVSEPVSEHSRHVSRPNCSTRPFSELPPPSSLASESS